MSRRLVAGVLAVVLALVGAFILVSYVSGADQRALQNLEPVTVVEVVEAVPAGTPADGLGERVAAVQLPATAVAEGAVTTLDQVAGQVTTTDLQPGEQLLASRFADPETFADSRAIEVPEDLQQVSVLLEARRVLGGYLEPGDTVGVFLSMTEPAQSKMILNKALVTRVQGGIALPKEVAPVDPTAVEQPPVEGPDPAAAPPPAEGVMVTLAVDLDGAEDIVFAAEHASLWLSVQPEEADEGGTRTVDREEILP